MKDFLRQAAKGRKQTEHHTTDQAVLWLVLAEPEGTGPACDQRQQSKARPAECGKIGRNREGRAKWDG